MQHQPVLEPSFTLESTSNTGLLPTRMIALLNQLNRFLNSWMLTTTLQKLEVLEADNDQQSQHVLIGIKLKGWVDPEHLRDGLNALVQNWSKQLLFADTKQQKACFSAHPRWLFVDLKEFSSSEQVDRMQRSTSHHMLYHVPREAGNQLHIYVFRLSSDTHMLYIMVRQRVPTTTTSMLLYKILDILSRHKTNSSSDEAAKASEDDIPLNGAQSLTLRELEILQYISRGLSNRAIAQKCSIAEGTVKRHVNNIYVKLNVGSRTQAVVMAQSLNLLL